MEGAKVIKEEPEQEWKEFLVSGKPFEYRLVKSGDGLNVVWTNGGGKKVLTIQVNVQTEETELLVTLCNTECFHTEIIENSFKTYDAKLVLVKQSPLEFIFQCNDATPKNQFKLLKDHLTKHLKPCLIPDNCGPLRVDTNINGAVEHTARIQNGSDDETFPKRPSSLEGSSSVQNLTVMIRDDEHTRRMSNGSDEETVPKEPISRGGSSSVPYPTISETGTSFFVSSWASSNQQTPRSDKPLHGVDGIPDFKTDDTDDPTDRPMTVVERYLTPQQVNNDETTEPRREDIPPIYSSVQKKRRDETVRSTMAIQRNSSKAETLLSNLNVRLTGDWENDKRVYTLINRVALALEKEDPPPLKSNGCDTVLCLDVSESLGEEGFEEVKRAAHRFVDDIDETSLTNTLEENISLVVMGGDVKIVRQMTNDYTSIRDAIDSLELGGRSRFLETLIMCVVAIKEKASTVVISGVHRIGPRIIFVTGGRLTSDNIETGPDSTNSDIDPMKDEKIKVIEMIKYIRKVESDIDPITWVAVGKRPETAQFLSSLAKLGDGHCIDIKDIQTLTKHFMIGLNVGKIFAYMKNHHDKWERNMETLENVTTAVIGELSAEVKETVINAVWKKLEFDTDPDPDQDPEDFGNVYEVSGIPPLGTLVMRGPGWKYDEQDLHGPGTVINHSSDKYHLWVYWDISCTAFRYRYGHDNKIDVIPVDDSPRLLRPDEFIEIGTRVKRGPNWSYGDQDGGPGNTGVVIRVRSDGVVKVKWLSNNRIEGYKYGADGRFDVAVCDPEEVLTQVPAPQDIQQKTAAVSRETTRDKPDIIWQWKDGDSNWRLYDKEHRDKLEREYEERPKGTCVLQKGSKTVRVKFSEPMRELIIGEGIRCEVKRSAVTDEELASLQGRKPPLSYR